MGILPETFWDSSLCEIVDMMESHIHREEHKRKQEILDHFVMAEVYGFYSSLPFAEGEVKTPKPWDYYPDFFGKEKEVFEKAEQEKALEEYREKRKEYILEFNRRRNQ